MQSLAILLAATTLLSNWTSPANAQIGPGALAPVLPADPQQCSNVTLEWSDTLALSEWDQQHYAVRIIDSATAGLALADEVVVSYVGAWNDTTSWSWRVGVPVGANITLLVTDNSGNRGYSAPTIVTEGSDRCMPKTVEPNSFNTHRNSASTASGSLQAVFASVASAAFALVAL